MALLEHVLQALQKADLVGSKLIPHGFQPTVKVGVGYALKEVALGNELQIDQTQEEPEVNFVDETAAQNQRFVVALMDPDAKSREDPCWAPFAHWIVGGLQAAHSGAPIGAKPLFKYMGPAPPPGTGPHRYVFLLYREPITSAEGESTLEGIVDQSKDEQKARMNFPIQEFVHKNKLELVGANFFVCENKEKEGSK